jgi:LPS-assembly lipoprotein
MWWLEKGEGFRRLGAAALAVTLAALTAGCFQPLYGDRAVTGGPGISRALNGVEVLPIDAPNGTPTARLAVEVRNGLIFNLTGGTGAAPATHQLNVSLSTNQQRVIVDVATARPEIENYGINATYTLTDLRTKQVVVKGETFARVSYDIPGQQQRFAAARGLRDAENRAAKVIADQIQSRLASYFVTGS